MFIYYLKRESFSHCDGVGVLIDGISDLLELAPVIGRPVIIQDRRICYEDIQGTIPKFLDTILNVLQGVLSHVLPKYSIRVLHVVLRSGRLRCSHLLAQ